MTEDVKEPQVEQEDRKAMVERILDAYPEAKTEEELYAAMKESYESPAPAESAQETQMESPAEKPAEQETAAPETAAPAEEKTNSLYGDRLGAIAARRAQRMKE